MKSYLAVFAILLGACSGGDCQCSSSDCQFPATSPCGDSLPPSPTTISAPVIVSPRDGTVVVDNPPTLTVTNATVSDGTASYNFEIISADGNVLFPPVTVVADIFLHPEGPGQTSWTPDFLRLWAGDYFWRAQAVAVVGNVGTPGPWSAVAHFTVPER